ncbi:hypothetical protein Rumal_2720 [Ruminococcus albus 7 = DSM 20455]|uniref:DNA binding domain-containing protein, excisionase family n=2 Tax=Ruminococcus albus TaxID=1264 RepID=E6UHB2_RUMA7|nr:hypothetical protein Rumal_2720 [Ruminococcus albus 7 = DSM 20455]
MQEYLAERVFTMENIYTRPLPKMRTIKETAAELNVPVYALRQWVKSGEVPAVYAGRKALLNLDLVIKFLNGGEDND